MFTYIPLSLPVPPEEYVDKILLDHSNGSLIWDPAQRERFEKSGSTYLERKVTWENKIFQTRVQYRYMLDQELDKWISCNLPTGYHCSSLAVSKGNSSIHGPHIDYNRHYILYYSIDTGGDNVQTSFWQRPNCPIEFDKPDWPGVAQDYPDLTHVESVVLKSNQWYLLNGWIYHSVEKMTGDRLSLQVDYNNIKFTLK